ncbi:MAG: hypothetical protein ACERKD_15555 [Prolixibacteraceae bacterium]
MSSDDYLTRYFQQLAKVLAALMGLYEKKKYQQAIDEINQVLDTWFALSLDELDGKSALELNEMVMNTPDQKMEKARSIAELLYQKTINLRAMNKMEEAIATSKISLLLFKSIDEKGDDFSIEIQQRIAELDQMA